MSTVSLSFLKARQGTSWYTSSTNPTVMGYENSSYYDQGALYQLSVNVTSGYTVNTLAFNIGNISGHSTSATGVYAVIYNYDPTNSFTNNTAPSNYVWRGYAQSTIYGDSGTSNIVISTGVRITSSGTYYVFITTDSGSPLDPFIRGSSNVSCSITNETKPDTPATSISVSNTMYMGSQTTISWTPYTSGYTYNISYKFTDSGTQTTIATGTTASSVAFTPPTSLGSLIPSTVSGTLTLYVKTYEGSTLKGQCSANFPLTIPISGRNPTASSGWASASFSRVASAYVAGYSRITASVANASAISYKYGATASTIVATCNSQSRSFSTSSSTAQNISLGTVIAGSNVVTITVTDSRGYTLVYQQTLTASAYSPPSFTSLNVIRCDSSANESTSGTYYAVTPNVSFTSVGTNSLTIQTRWQVFGGTYSGYTNISNGVKSSALGGGQITTTNSYLIEVRAYDTIGGSSVQTRTLTNTSVAATFNLKSNGLGAAFFGLSTTDGQLSVYGDVASMSNTTGDLSAQSRSGAMIIDPGTTATWLGNCNGLFKGNGDGITTGTSGIANLFIKSWYGVGFVDGCTGNGITVGIDCRTGALFANSLTSYGSLDVSGNATVNGSLTSGYHVMSGGQTNGGAFYGTAPNAFIARYGSIDFIIRNDGGTFYLMPGANATANGGWTAGAYVTISQGGYWTFPAGLNAGGRVISSILNSSNKGTGTPSGGQDGDVYFQYS